ncbi:asparagine synthase (glutamine-hydrolyzing) [Fulvivirga sp.]|uniref:asparagine synthase (glutamine-hydrolyzing) n=1 Tax=Fulvivirga sp. TaxID=1931237 RepID=UPI0032EDAFB3
MCGICGYLNFGDRMSQQDKLVITEMNKTLVHRGPDEQAISVFDNVALGFSRLSIIGLETGMQPIYNEDDSVILICNGEIFNYIELKRDLELSGHQFKTESDVEVLIHLYEDIGMDLLNKVTGQFAFALYDKKKRQLFCARDQMGIVPLYYTLVESTFIFASEIKALLKHPKVSAELDLVGLDQVMTFAGLISPRTMFKGIKSLANGHYLTVNSAGETELNEYWDLIYPEGEVHSTGTSKEEKLYTGKLEELLDRSINLRLRADVPSGLYLSGGLDSSIIATKVKQLRPDGQKEAFSIDFVDSRHSESIYQKRIAEVCQMNLNQKMFFFEDISTRLRESIYHSECPIKETYNTASLSLSEAVRKKGIKVILSGEGADEFFAGYVGYRFDKLRAMKMVDNPTEKAEANLRDRLWCDPDFFYEMNYLKHNKLKHDLYAKDLSSEFDEFDCLNHFVINKNRLRNRSVLNRRAYIDYKIRLVDHLVSDHGDRMALANSVEVRYPFLDIDLVEFSTTIPEDLKLNQLTEKYILKSIAQKLMPQEVAQREKFHFIAPGSPYLLQSNIEYINDLLSYDLIKRQGIFNPDTVESLKKTYGQPGFQINAPYESDLLIIVITLGILLDTFFGGGKENFVAGRPSSEYINSY